MGKKPTRYELILLFDWYKKFSIAEMHKRLKPHYSLSSLYRYHAIYSSVSRKARELGERLK